MSSSKSALSTPYALRAQRDGPVTVHTANYVEMKITVEEQLKLLLSLNFKFMENHAVMDRQLFFGYTSFILAAGGATYSYTYGFDHTKLVTFLCLVGYVIVAVVLGLFNMSLKKDRIYLGLRKDPLGLDPDQHLSITSRLDKITGELILVFTFHSKKRKNTCGFTMTKSFGAWFDVNGHLVVEKFQREMSESIQKGLDMLSSSGSTANRKESQEPKKTK